jgi:simple sugar transport system substrate-binding protein
MSKKKVLALLLGVLMLVSVLTACGSPKATPDNSPGEATTPSTDPGTSAADYEIAVVVKITGIQFFNVMEEGVKKAAQELGVNAYVVGPTQADAAEQVKIIEDLITAKVDAIVVVPNDATALETVLERAREAGILVIANESPGQTGADYDVELIDNTKFAIAAAESAAKAMGGAGEYALYVGGLSVPLHNTWADIVEDYLGENYPDMKLVTDRIACGEDAALARTTTLDLLTTYPGLKGVIGFGSQGPLGAAEAVKESGLIGKFAVVGNVVPSEAADYLKEGSITEGYLWNPASSGYACVFTAYQLLGGGSVTDGKFEVPGIGAPELKDNGVLAYDDTLVITADNASTLGF